ncbi:unnamed protein product, partial [Rotaria sp. Silwood1]
KISAYIKRGRPPKRSVGAQKLAQAFSTLTKAQIEALDTTTWSTKLSGNAPSVKKYSQHDIDNFAQMFGPDMEYEDKQQIYENNKCGEQCLENVLDCGEQYVQGGK